MKINVSAKDLAQCIGVSPGFASQIRTGHRKLPPKYCMLVSERFGIPLNELRPDIYPASFTVALANYDVHRNSNNPADCLGDVTYE